MRSPLVVVLLAFAALPTFAAQPPSVAFEPEAVVVSGLAPQAQVAWMSVSREARAGYSRVVRREGIAQDHDRDGVIRLEPEGEGAIAPRSVWAVVDLASGELALAAPGGVPVREKAFPGRGLTRGASGKLDRFEAVREIVDILFVRPGATPGAWVLTAGDGGEGDDDLADDGVLAATLATAQPVGESAAAAPEELAAGDVVVAVDPRSLEVFAVRLKPGQ